jgi:threonine dehydrogenase-like Zn-dependent dehydrogenase
MTSPHVVDCFRLKADSALEALTGYVGVPHGVDLDGQSLFFSQTGMLGGPAPVRRFLPHLVDLILKHEINPGKVFDLDLLADAAEGYRAMDERRAIKTLLRT